MPHEWGKYFSFADPCIISVIHSVSNSVPNVFINRILNEPLFSRPLAVCCCVAGRELLQSPGRAGIRWQTGQARAHVPSGAEDPERTPHVCAPAAHILISKEDRRGAASEDREAQHAMSQCRCREEISPGHRKEGKGTRALSCVHRLPSVALYPPLPPKPHTVSQTQGDKNHFARMKALFPILALFIGKSFPKIKAHLVLNFYPARIWFVCKL